VERFAKVQKTDPRGAGSAALRFWEARAGDTLVLSAENGPETAVFGAISAQTSFALVFTADEAPARVTEMHKCTFFGGASVKKREGAGDMDGKKREYIRPGLRVRVVQKRDQPTGRLTEGIVEAVLTRSATHPHGIKVRLAGGVVGRVKEIVE
jgi:uncharacterized repeat protein (TIGR03833 family)